MGRFNPSCGNRKSIWPPAELLRLSPRAKDSNTFAHWLFDTVAIRLTQSHKSMEPTVGQKYFATCFVARQCTKCGTYFFHFMVVLLFKADY